MRNLLHKAGAHQFIWWTLRTILRFNAWEYGNGSSFEICRDLTGE